MHNLTKNLLYSIVIILGFSNCARYKTERNKTFQKIEDLKNTVLLVRLNTSNNKIKHLKKYDLVNDVKEQEMKTFQKQKQTILAFEEHFDFCKVYFYNAEDGTELRHQNFDKVQLIDVNEDIVTDNSFLKDGYLVGIFGYSYDTQIVYQSRDSLERRPMAGSGGVSSLLIVDKDYVQLPKPFPFSVNYTFEREDKSVKELNRALNTFYLKSKRRKLRGKM